MTERPALRIGLVVGAQIGEDAAAQRQIVLLRAAQEARLEQRERGGESGAPARRGAARRLLGLIDPSEGGRHPGAVTVALGLAGWGGMLGEERARRVELGLGARLIAARAAELPQAVVGQRGLVAARAARGVGAGLAGRQALDVAQGLAVERLGLGDLAQVEQRIGEPVAAGGAAPRVLAPGQRVIGGAVFCSGAGEVSSLAPQVSLLLPPARR